MIIGKPGDCFNQCTDVPFFLLGRSATVSGHSLGFTEYDRRTAVQEKKKWTCAEANRIGCSMDFGNVIFRPTGKPLKCCNTDAPGAKSGTWGVQNPDYAPNSRIMRSLKERLAAAIEQAKYSKAKKERQKVKKYIEKWEKIHAKDEKEVKRLEGNFQHNKKRECELPRGSSYQL
jgi:hypothetical protein